MQDKTNRNVAVWFYLTGKKEDKKGILLGTSDRFDVYVEKPVKNRYVVEYKPNISVEEIYQQYAVFKNKPGIYSASSIYITKDSLANYYNNKHKAAEANAAAAEAAKAASSVQSADPPRTLMPLPPRKSGGAATRGIHRKTKNAKKGRRKSRKQRKSNKNRRTNRSRK